ncbi:MAG: hypothetical protein M3P84_11875 [Chloroflexota bacterium]|nr:hypothetical protein [Chloroflexota bacterium]
MDRDEFERCREAIDAATAALNAQLDAVEGSMFGSGTADSSPLESVPAAGAATLRWLAEFDRLVRTRDEAEAERAVGLVALHPTDR